MQHHVTGQFSAPSMLPPAQRKRLKVAVACMPCRHKKIKCDGVRPDCGSCKRIAGVKCVYATGHVETSIDHKEQLFHRASGNRDALDGSRTVSTHNQTLLNGSSEGSGQHSCMAGGGGVPLTVLSASRLPPAVNQGNFESEAHTADSMNGVTGDPKYTRDIFGRSSAGSFMRQIQTAINPRPDASSSDPPEKGAVTRGDSPGVQPVYSSYETSTLLLLPPKALADSLMQVYWDYDWTLYPIIDRGQVEETYESLWTSRDTMSFPLLRMSIINLCFALGCHYGPSVPPKERRDTGDSFFSRAECLYNKAKDAPSSERVQCLLLFGVYLQSTKNVFQCWMTVGEAIRMAQSLGMHLPEPEFSSQSVSHREYRRRIWHGCVWLDRVLSATFGRPGMIPNWLFSSVPLPSMIDDEFFEAQTEGSERRPDGQPCIMAFLGKAIELYRILDDVLVELYLTCSPREEGIESKLPHILEIDSRIQSWSKSLPGHLQIHTAATGNTILDRQATVLRIHSLHVRILLFRPTLVRYCSRGAPSYTEKPNVSADPSLSEVMLFQCPRMCFRFAHELIDIFNRNLDPQTLNGPLPVWWYSVFYVYTAATTILVERFLETRDSAENGESAASQTWHAAINVLRSYGALSDCARRCVAALEVLYNNLSLDNGENGTTSHPRDAASDRDSLLGLFNQLNQPEEMNGPGLLPLSFDDLIWLDSILESSY
ncbi:fungal-specific transcription factor domain-containing protein [Aspergillus caelatus]|uniref:Fungal-specific transcription factor domain-containing protein n=2 Tax=Aspergillus subgen. Circumdati TaxID=2720871 RepID=A0A5N6ZTI5_9EURO|nr:fungal-specific transcription factor domain-containing protein [Aspergillus caelatus]KAE8360842.1 fungal-specific transcription factor domain-containing protein [Aspergillus caelatus]KAE8410921.1 fungal-specific transcription factor domain-containing protein [Aspergillus pseudocaelatus]